MFHKINRFISRISIEPQIVTFVSKIAFSVDENLEEFKERKNSGYGEFEI